ncbi:fatty acid-binding protein, brain-like [Glandiceps talaboti]
MAAGLIGKWKTEREEGVEAILKASGANAEEAAAIKADQQTFDIKKDGDTYVIEVTSSLIGHSVTRFKIGEQYDAPLIFGGKGKFVASIDGEKIHVKQQGGMGVERIYELKGDNMVLTFKIGENSASLYFTKA